MLKTVKWSYLVVDEAHRIKNEQSLLAKTVRVFTSTHRLLITGTPIQNNLHELWSLLNFLMPSVFNDSSEFDKMYEEMTGDYSKGNIQSDDVISRHVSTMQKIIKPFILRRLKAEVDRTIPPKKELYVFVGMTTMQRNIYKKCLTKDFQSLGFHNSQNKFSSMFTNLRKCASHPYLFVGQEQEPFEDGPHIWEASEKMRVLDMLLEKLYAKGSRALIFSQWTSMLDIIDD